MPSDLDIKLLLHDHAQASEEARYRDTLLFHGFYFSLAIFALFLNAVIMAQNNRDYYLCALVCAIATIVFFIFIIALKSISRARDIAWERRNDIENSDLLKGQVKINKYIKERRRKWLERRSAKNWIIGFEIFSILFWFFLFFCFLFNFFA